MIVAAENLYLCDVCTVFLNCSKRDVFGVEGGVEGGFIGVEGDIDDANVVRSGRSISSWYQS